MDTEHILAPAYNAEEANTPDLVEEVRKRITDWTLPLKPRTDYDFIVKFVRAKRYDAVKAEDAIQRYYNRIFKYWNKLKGIKPSSFKVAFDSQAFVILKYKVQGTQPYYWQMKNWETNKFNIEEYLTSMMFLGEELAKKEEVQPHGIISIINLDGMNLSQLRQFTPGVMKYYQKLGIDGLPIRQEAIHFVNTPRIFWPLFGIFMQMLPKKYQNCVYLHDDMNSLHKFINRNKLPLSLGGFLEETEAVDKELLKKLLANDRCYDEYWSTDACSCQQKTTENQGRRSLCVGPGHEM